MKFKENMKRFWNLSRSNGGFTLVELIVVIAILAILGGVAVPAYSAYVTRANRGVDESLASEIEHAMVIAYYDGTLQPGASVVVYYGDAGDAEYNVVVDPEGTDLGAAAAMTAAFGDNYATSLRLKWNGWKDVLGNFPSADQMANVQGSNFNSNNMGNMLGQVQTVVNAAAGYFENVGTIDPDSEVAGYLDNAGIDYSSGLNSSNSGAAANALVFVVAGNMSNIGTENNLTQDEFYRCWVRNDFSATGWDAATKEAASYAMIYGAATYVDTQAGTTYRQQMEGDFNSIINNGKTVLNKIKSDNATQWSAYISGGNSSLMHKDAMAFLTYMQGVSNSADALTSTTDLRNNNYFNDGTVLNYVNDYVTLNEVLADVDMKNGAFVFYFNGESVSCLPLNY